ncbi:MAG TPA: hypothetical protein VEC75_04605, partial [Stellaceae bacterium]|nr:hypothetical protein [Stellaceae bacterium]
MSERREEPTPAASPAEDAKFVEMSPAPAAHARRAPFAWLVLAAVLMLVVLSPYWAPPVASILPWGTRGTDAAATADPRLDALERKGAGIEARLAEAEKTAQRLTALEQRLGQ